MEQKTLLITAFEPFGGEDLNPSALAMERLSAQIGRFVLQKRLLEVTFNGAVQSICEYVDKIKPDAVICLGQAGGRAAITPERVAINIMDARAGDNSGYAPQDEPVIAGAPTAYFATLPIKRMVSAMQKAGVDAAISNSAGTYVCNAVMYALLDNLSKASPYTQAGFIHVPYIIEQVKAKPGMPAMPLDDIVRGLSAAIAAMDTADQNIE